MWEYFTRENITLFLSIIGSLGALCNAIYYWITHREKLDIKITGQRINEKAILLYVSFTNNSAVPSNVTDVRLIANNQTFFAYKNPKVIKRNTFKVKNEIVNYNENYNESFPITIPAYGGNACYIYFAFPLGHDLTSSTPLCFEFLTSRHKIIQKKLQLQTVDLLD